MFKDFDSAVFEQPEFKEDAVREEIVAPILRRLGYKPHGTTRVIRSKTLTHPFIRVGTRQHGVTTVPDYTLYHEDKAVLVLDAKAPSESVLDPAHVQQAYSYAIHPEVRCKHFALCNGRELVVFSTDVATPLLHIEFAKYEASWHELEKYLGPRYLAFPALRMFRPDFGLRIARMGVARDAGIILHGIRPTMFTRLDDWVFSATGNVKIEGEICCASFDFPHRMLPAVTSPLAEPLAVPFRAALARSPYSAYADMMLEIDLTARLGTEVTVRHETFVPLIVLDVAAARLNREPVADPGDIPPHIFRLRRAFDALRGESG